MLQLFEPFSDPLGVPARAPRGPIVDPRRHPDPPSHEPPHVIDVAPVELVGVWEPQDFCGAGP